MPLPRPVSSNAGGALQELSALEGSHRCGFQPRSDDEDNATFFESLRSLARHVARHRAQ